MTPREIAKTAMLAPIRLYRLAISPLLGANCRHLPTCSDYASEAIGLNGAWKGGWLTFARLARCHPFGSSGFDPVPDLGGERHSLAPWRYGRWRGRGPRSPMRARTASDTKAHRTRAANL